MEQLIDFRSQLDSLSKNEFTIFVNKHLNRQTISSALYHLLVHESNISTDANDNYQTQFKASIQSIVNKRRKTKCQSNNDLVSMSLQSTPSDIIGYLTTFLSDNDTIQLSLISRHLFCSCKNQPRHCTMDHMDLETYHQHCHENNITHNYKSLLMNVTELNFNIFASSYNLLSYLSSFKRMRVLEIDLELIRDIDDEDEIKLIESRVQRLTNAITHIDSLEQLSFVVSHVYFREFLKLEDAAELFRKLLENVPTNIHHFSLDVPSTKLFKQSIFENILRLNNLRIMRLEFNIKERYGGFNEDEFNEIVHLISEIKKLNQNIKFINVGFGITFRRESYEAVMRKLKSMQDWQWGDTEVRIFFNFSCDSEIYTAPFEQIIKEIIGNCRPNGMEINSEIYRNDEGWAFYTAALGFEVIFNKQQCNEYLYDKYFRIKDLDYLEELWPDMSLYGWREWNSIYEKRSCEL